jgi:activator of 2-hydroxyglutaryl-CoA dehydratase
MQFPPPTDCGSPRSPIAGVHKVISARVTATASGLTVRPDAVFTGGVAKNIGVKKFLEEEFGNPFFSYSKK